jgi:anthranilate phosphoribosyltransferase
VMNMVGPLANPARAGRQVLGVADQGRLALMAGALQSLGTIHAMVVHGAPGMDEVSPLGPTKVIEIRGKKTKEWTIDPNKFDFGTIKAGDLAGGPPAENARIVLGVLRGDGPAAATAAVVLNAAAAIYVSGTAASYEEAVECASTALKAGSGVVALDRLRSASRPLVS